MSQYRGPGISLILKGRIYFVIYRCREDVPKITNYWETTVPMYDYRLFRRTFRVTPAVFEHIADRIENELSADNIGGRPAIPPYKQVAIFLKYVGSTDTVFQLGQTFNVSESSVIKSRRSVMEAILTVEKGLQWPAQHDLQQIADDFNNTGNYRFPNIVGALDGSHIRVGLPRDQPNYYYNRKKYHSVILQGVCTTDTTFIDLSVGCPGRMHDARVLRKSSLWDSGLAKCGMGQYHIIADAAYPLRRWLMTPYRDCGNLTPRQVHYNKVLSTKRVVIERAFGMLKKRFKRLLQGVEIVDMKEIEKLVMACCILHNKCVAAGDDEDFYDDFIIIPPPQQPPGVQINDEAEGRIKRTLITNNLQ